MRPTSMLARLGWTALLLGGLTGCGFDPVGDTPLDPPPVYREWWAKTQACSGLSGDFERVRWSTIDINIAFAVKNVYVGAIAGWAGRKNRAGVGSHITGGRQYRDSGDNKCSNHDSAAVAGTILSGG